MLGGHKCNATTNTDFGSGAFVHPLDIHIETIQQPHISYPITKMGEFDFDDDNNNDSDQHQSSPSSSSSKATSSNSHSSSNNNVNLLSKGRTTKRRTKKVLLKGADAIAESQRIENERLEVERMKDERKRREKRQREEELSRRFDDELEMMPVKKGRANGTAATPSSSAAAAAAVDEGNNDVNKEENDNFTTGSSIGSKSSISRGGRRKKRPKVDSSTKSAAVAVDGTPSSQSRLSWGEGSMASSISSVKQSATKSVGVGSIGEGWESSAFSGREKKSPGTPNNTPPNSQNSVPPSSGDSKSVRFSLSSITQHVYQQRKQGQTKKEVKEFGTPPGSPDLDRKPAAKKSVGTTRASVRAMRAAKSNNNEETESPDIIDKILNKGNVKPSTAVNDSLDEDDYNDFDDFENTFLVKASTKPMAKQQSASATRHTIPNNIAGKKLPPSCLKSNPSFAKSANSSSSSPHSSPSKSSYSSSSYGSARVSGLSKRKKHRSRRFNLGYSLPSLGGETEEYFDPDSPEETPMITVGRQGFSRDVSDVQDVGNYRMLIDDLSYLCSAILHCKMRPTHCDIGGGRVIFKHTSVTAGAACDLAETISQPQTRSALLMLGAQASRGTVEKRGKTSNVGALSAVLEAVACAPPVIDLTEACRQVIDGKCNTSYEASSKKPSDGDGISSLFARGRTKNVRRKQSMKNSQSDNLTIDLDNVPVRYLEVRSKHDAIASKALSIVTHCVGVDCTGSERAALASKGPRNRAAIKAARNGVLQHKAALQGIARLVADDPVVDAYLRLATNAQSMSDVGDVGNDSNSCAAETLQHCDDECSVASSSSKSSKLSAASSLDANNDFGSDPTKSGRRRGRKKMPRIRQLSASSQLGPISEVDDAAGANPTSTSGEVDDLIKEGKASKSSTPLQSSTLVPVNGGTKLECLDFQSEEGSHVSRGSVPDTNNVGNYEKVDMNSDYRFQEKIALALSRAKLGESVAQATLASELDATGGEEDSFVCKYCSLWVPKMIESSSNNTQNSSTSASSLALEAADCIISGKDKSILPGENDDEDTHEEDDDDDDFLGNNQQSVDDVAKNPILFANEMLRKSGSLPEYSRSMAGTLASILLSCSPVSPRDEEQPRKCSKCIAYLQHRVSTFSSIVDSLCCLSPEASKALSSSNTLLVPSLIRVIADLSFNNGGTISPESDETIMTALKTLTSLTHENEIACDQLISPYPWSVALPVAGKSIRDDHSMSQISGLEIIFSHLFKTVPKTEDNDGETLNEKSGYDTTIFCLNILTNIVEMIPNPTKSLAENMVIVDDQSSAVSWLAQWIVSKTSGFRGAVMKGSFGSTESAAIAGNDDSELRAGEEGNLVTAGNGFVLLSYLMLDDGATASSSSIRDIVKKELPTDDAGDSGGVKFMIKTLKAFCNFYHYSVGDLSVAVIAPIIKLIAGLEKIDIVEQRKKWL